jgi:hypothetical protein
MLIGYGKIGRSMPLTLQKCGVNGGDTEMVPPIAELARRHPDDTFVLVGRNSGETAAQAGLPENVVNPWTEWGWKDRLKESMRRANLTGNFDVKQHLKLRAIHDDITLSTFQRLDALVLWVGQHGTSNGPNTMIDDPTTLTKPYDSYAFYGAFLLRGINAFREDNPFKKEEVLLNADPRNYLKYRDTRWPLQHPVQTQHEWTHVHKHERFGDTTSPDVWNENTGQSVESLRDDNTLWKSEARNVYTRLEVNGLLPGTPFGDLLRFNSEWEDRRHFGLFANYAGSTHRLAALRDYALPLDPAFVHGSWTPSTQRQLDREIVSAPWDRYVPLLHSVRCTLAVPSNAGWATTKPWEAFAAGTVCFFHPGYDTQGHILRDAPEPLRQWLLVKNVDDLRTRVRFLNSEVGHVTWQQLVAIQREHFDAATRELTYMKKIEERIYG